MRFCVIKKQNNVSGTWVHYYISFPWPTVPPEAFCVLSEKDTSAIFGHHMSSQRLPVLPQAFALSTKAFLDIPQRNISHMTREATHVTRNAITTSCTMEHVTSGILCNVLSWFPGKVPAMTHVQCTVCIWARDKEKDGIIVGKVRNGESTRTVVTHHELQLVTCLQLWGEISTLVVNQASFFETLWHIHPGTKTTILDREGYWREMSQSKSCSKSSRLMNSTTNLPAW